MTIADVFRKFAAPKTLTPLHADGVRDDTKALQQRIDRCRLLSQTFRLSYGRYAVTQLDFTGVNVEVHHCAFYAYTSAALTSTAGEWWVGRRQLLNLGSRGWIGFCAISGMTQEMTKAS